MSPSEGVSSAGLPPHAHRVKVARRRRRQTFTFLGLFGFVVLIGMVAVGNWEGWWTIGGRAEAAAVICPTQVVSDPNLTKVNVLNGTNRHGLAASVAKQLQTRGFLVLEIDTELPAKPMQEVATIRYGKLGQLQAHTVALEFPGPVKLVKDQRTSQTVDVVLGEKYKQMANAGKAKTATTLTEDPIGCITPTPAASPTPSLSRSAKPKSRPKPSATT